MLGTCPCTPEAKPLCFRSEAFLRCLVWLPDGRQHPEIRSSGRVGQRVGCLTLPSVNTVHLAGPFHPGASRVSALGCFPSSLLPKGWDLVGLGADFWRRGGER